VRVCDQYVVIKDEGTGQARGLTRCIIYL
jgi:hypothetical protein